MFVITYNIFCKREIFKIDIMVVVIVLDVEIIVVCSWR